MNVLGVLRPLELLRSAGSGSGGTILVPIALTAPDGTLFTDENGIVLTYGTQRVRPIEESE